MKTKHTIAAFVSMTALICCLPSGLAAQNQDAQSPLIISDGSRFETKGVFPRFSWEVTPQYFMFGDTGRVLRANEVESIAARTDFLCIEKSHGSRQLGFAELGARHEAAAFKNLKPEMKVLFYFNSAYAWPFTSYNQMFKRGKIDDHPELKGFLMVDPGTGELAHRRNIFFFDVLKPELVGVPKVSPASDAREELA